MYTDVDARVQGIVVHVDRHPIVRHIHISFPQIDALLTQDEYLPLVEMINTHTHLILGSAGGCRAGDAESVGPHSPLHRNIACSADLYGTAKIG